MNPIRLTVADQTITARFAAEDVDRIRRQPGGYTVTVTVEPAP